QAPKNPLNSKEDAQAVLKTWRALFPVLESSAMAMKDVFDSSTLSGELAARRLSVQGDQSGAERIRLVLQQRRELADLQNQTQGLLVRPEIFAELERVQNLELQNFDVREKATKAIDELKRAEAEYAEGVKRRSDLVEAGTIREFQATQQNLQGAASVRELGAATLEQIRMLQAQNPELSAGLDEYRRQVEDLLRNVQVVAPQAGRTFGQGLSDGLDEFIAKSQDAYGQARQLVLGIADTFTNNLSTAITNTITGVSSLKDAFREFAVATLRQITGLITQMLVLRAIGGIASAFSGGGGGDGVSVPFAGRSGVLANAMGNAFSAGRVVPFAAGGVVSS
ncbi:MAG: hypothetical protein K2Q20_11465, partial [Phycisphaerales bacterium]|nr:hypothetical protein [Phycisphaerales bacterium]